MKITAQASVARFEVFMAVIHVKVFWVVMLYNVAVGYHRFRGSCCLHLQQGSKVLQNPGTPLSTTHHNPEEIKLSLL